MAIAAQEYYKDYIRLKEKGEVEVRTQIPSRDDDTVYITKHSLVVPRVDAPSLIYFLNQSENGSFVVPDTYLHNNCSPENLVIPQVMRRTNAPPANDPYAAHQEILAEIRNWNRQRNPDTDVKNSLLGTSIDGLYI